MKILIVRPWPSVLDVTKNTYNIQEVGLAKALVKRGHPTDILFWTDGDEMTVKVEVEGAKPINVFYRHGKVPARTGAVNFPAGACSGAASRPESAGCC